MTKTDATEMLTLLKESLHYIGCGCGMSHIKPCASCVLTTKIKELIDRIEPKKEEKQ